MEELEEETYVNDRDYAPKLNELESFDADSLYRFLAAQETLKSFLNCIRAVRGASLEALENGESAVFLKGKLVPDTIAKRFTNPEQLSELLAFANLTYN